MKIFCSCICRRQVFVLSGGEAPSDPVGGTHLTHLSDKRSPALSSELGFDT